MRFTQRVNIEFYHDGDDDSDDESDDDDDVDQLPALAGCHPVTCSLPFSLGICTVTENCILSLCVNCNIGCKFNLNFHIECYYLERLIGIKGK